jgi:hypothetical protein
MLLIFNSIQKKLCKHCLTNVYKHKSVTVYFMILIVMINRVVLGYETLSMT